MKKLIVTLVTLLAIGATTSVISSCGTSASTGNLTIKGAGSN